MTADIIAAVSVGAVILGAIAGTSLRTGKWMAKVDERIEALEKAVTGKFEEKYRHCAERHQTCDAKYTMHVKTTDERFSLHREECGRRVGRLERIVNHSGDDGD